MPKKPNVVVRFVKRHPGIKGQPYLLPAHERAVKLLKEKLIPLAVKRAQKSGKLEAELEWAVRGAAFSAQQSAVRQCPVDTGRLRASLNVQRRKPLYYTVGTNVRYARVVEFGTRKKNYPIFPKKTGGLLAFYSRKKAKRKKAKRRRRRT